MLLNKSSRQKNQKGAKIVEVNYLKMVCLFLREQEAGIYQENMLTSIYAEE